MKLWRFHFRIALQTTVLAFVGLGLSTGVNNLASPQSPIPADANQPNSADELALTQSRLADKYQNLEKLLLRMAEYDAGLNPQRAELLLRVFSESKDRQVQLQFENLVQLLRDEQLGKALGGQKDLRTDLDAMLKLLMSENRSDRLKSEKARIREYIREVERLERMQRSVQGRTEGGVPHGETAQEQQELSDRTRELDREITKNDEPLASPDRGPTDGDIDAQGASEPSPGAEPKDARESKRRGSDPSAPSESEEGKPPSSTDSPDETSGTPGKSGEASESGETPNKSSDAQGESGDTPNKSDESSDSSSSGESGEAAENGKQSPSDGGLPGQKNIQKAQQAMQRAVEKLQKAERDGAVQEQAEAVKELAEAKARLEEILRQMREEEIERTLALLEARVKAMLDMQIRIHDETVRLDESAVGRVDRSWEIEAGKLGFEQRRVVLEADKALALLREEGSSAAFPETLSQARSDMEQVAIRLSQAKTGAVTQSIEDDIIAALEEMLEALKQAQQEQRQRQQDQAPMAQEPGEMPLVDQIAELKMIKSLQLRINRRTNRYAQLLGSGDDEIGQATDNELVAALQELSDREGRLHELTRDIVLGKNR